MKTYTKNYHQCVVLEVYLIWKSNYLTLIDKYYLRNQSRENNLVQIFKVFNPSFPSELYSSLTQISSVSFEPVKMWKLKF